MSSLEAADDELFARPRQRHIQQAAALLQRLLFGRLFRRPDLFGGVLVGHRVHDGAIIRVQKVAALARRIGQGCGVRQDDDVGFQPLGAVHGHHAHLVAAAVHVALDLGVALFHPMQEALQAGGVERFIGQRQREEFVDGVIGFGAQPPDQPLAHAVMHQRGGIEFVRRFVVGLGAHFLQEGMCEAEHGVLALAHFQFAPQRALAVDAQRVELFFGQAKHG